MSLQIPIRLKIEENGVVRGYVETLDLPQGSVTVVGPVAHIRGSGGGGGDADTLQGHPASYFATEADMLAAEAQLAAMMDRASMWATLGVQVTATPVAGITYADWLAGAAGYWGWIRIP